MSTFASEADRLESFRTSIDAIGAQAALKVGNEDLAHVRRVDRFSKGMQVAGRLLLHVSMDPLTWGAGVFALFIAKQLEATEVGHMVLHGAYDKIEGNTRYQSKTWKWQVPIDESAWHTGHNIRHHQYTNIVGKDPDVRYGAARLNAAVPWKPQNASQHVHGPLSWLGFGFNMNAHFTGLVDIFVHDEGDHDFVDKKDPKQRRAAYRAAFRKWGPYYGKEFVLFPLLAGAFWWKVMLGNAASELLRDVYSAATIWCGHVGEEVAAYPEGSRAHGRAQWQVMQVEAANNYEVPYLVSILCGGLDRQIEHHLFPKLPTNRLREIAPEVRRVCEEHGVRYRSAGWGTTLYRAVREVFRLRKQDAPLRAVSSIKNPTEQTFAA